ncbi:MAG: hypothetical protein K8H89_14145 [Flavobacteriales bacterium]|jgi:hypothetical protein|nr:hypothetical protein [Flavobacteriales bacterium]MCB0757036.1 hypothetical protein [Flavobacteriales bacterium]
MNFSAHAIRYHKLIGGKRVRLRALTRFKHEHHAYKIRFIPWHGLVQVDARFFPLTLQLPISILITGSSLMVASCEADSTHGDDETPTAYVRVNLHGLEGK